MGLGIAHGDPIPWTVDIQKTVKRSMRNVCNRSFFHRYCINRMDMIMKDMLSMLHVDHELIN